MHSFRITDVNDVVYVSLLCLRVIHSLVSLVSLAPHIQHSRRPTLIVNRGCHNMGIPRMAAASVASTSEPLPPPPHLYG